MCTCEDEEEEEVLSFSLLIVADLYEKGERGERKGGRGNNDLTTQDIS